MIGFAVFDQKQTNAPLWAGSSPTQQPEHHMDYHIGTLALAYHPSSALIESSHPVQMLSTKLTSPNTIFKNFLHMRV